VCSRYDDTTDKFHTTGTLTSADTVHGPQVMINLTIDLHFSAQM